MILIGGATISEERRRAYELGAITAFLAGDTILAVSTGCGPDWDAQFWETVAPDGTWLLTGRVRAHRDDRVRDSADHKTSISFAVAPGLPEQARGEVRWALGATVRHLLGAELLRTEPTEPILFKDINQAVDLLGSAMSRHGGATKIVTFEAPAGPAERAP